VLVEQSCLPAPHTAPCLWTRDWRALGLRPPGAVVLWWPAWLLVVAGCWLPAAGWHVVLCAGCGLLAVVLLRAVAAAGCS
jgi:hypothetical protein